ncbi:MAG TPA: MFS transporter [Chitinivibrionales bacterium]|nr:MFS transporter [Chitinivibrionales bacterium]
MAAPKPAKQILGGVDVGSPLLRKALMFSLTDGMFCSVMVALADTFSVAAAVRLRAPAMTIALLGSAPLLIGSVGQFFLPLFLNKNQTRKHYVVASVRVQAMFLILAGITGWLPAPYNAWAYVLAFILYGSSGNLFQGIWMSWLRDCVPAGVRGRHFAWRNRFFSLVQLACAITAGILSRKYSSQNAPWMFFTIIFFIGSLFRFGSGQFLSWQYEPPQSKPPDRSEVFGFRPSKNFLWFCASVALLQGTTAIAGPFFNVWFLRDLRFDYLVFTIGTASMIVGTILFLPAWGRLIDFIGTSRVLRLTALMCAFVPVPYLFGSSPLLVWTANFFSGIAWGGFNIANFNYLLRTTEKENSDHYIAFAAAVTAVGLFVFSLLGGFLATRLPTLFDYQLQTLFLVSFACRLFVVLFFYRKFRQPEMRVEEGTFEIVNESAGYKVGMEILRQVVRALRK